MLIDNAFAQAAANEPSLIASLLPMVLIVVIFYIFIIRPQQKQRKQHQEMVENLAVKNKVILASGIKGKITKVEEKEVTIEIAKDVEIACLKSFVAKVED